MWVLIEFSGRKRSDISGTGRGPSFPLPSDRYEKDRIALTDGWCEGVPRPLLSPPNPGISFSGRNIDATLCEFADKSLKERGNQIESWRMIFFQGKELKMSIFHATLSWSRGMEMTFTDAKIGCKDLHVWGDLLGVRAPSFFPLFLSLLLGAYNCVCVSVYS